MKHKVEYWEKKKFYSEIGYAFVDEYHNCQIIVYGEFLRDFYKKVFDI